MYLIAALLILIPWGITKTIQTYRLHQAETQQLQQENKLLEEAKTKSKVEQEQLKKQIEAKEKEIQRLKQSKANVSYASSGTKLSVSEQEAKMYIYKHESGNRPNAVSSNGCIGLGQACPFGAKPRLVRECPNWQTDYACQDKYWTYYATSKYGGWIQAYAYWLRNRSW